MSLTVYYWNIEMSFQKIGILKVLRNVFEICSYFQPLVQYARSWNDKKCLRPTILKFSACNQEV